MSFTTLLVVLQVFGLAAIVIEAENKMRRTEFLAAVGRRGMTPLQRVVTVLRGVAWSLLMLGACGALALLVLDLPARQRELFDAIVRACLLAGMGTMIVRSRLKELLPGHPTKAESDDFTQTQIIRRR